MSTQRIQRPGNSISRATATTIKRVQKRGNGSESRRPDQAEKALRESEEKYRNLFENARDMIVLVDTETGTILDVNTAGCNLLGLPKETIIGKHQSELHPPELAEKYKQLFQDHVQKGVVVNDDVVVQRADGVQIPMDLSANVVKLADKTIIQGVFRDITERVRMEQALRESEEKFSKAFHALPEEVTIARLKDNVFIDVNEGFCRNNGYTREEVIGRKGEELNLLIKPGQRDQVMKMVKERGRAENIELEFRKESGEIHTLLFSADIINLGGEPCLLTIGNDISQRKQMEKTLRESEEKFSKAFQTSPEAIAIVSAKDEKYIDINDNYTKMFGYSREELIGNKAFVNNWATPEVHTKMHKMLQEQGRICNEEFDYRTKSGEIRTRLLSLEPITINGEPCRIGFSLDITERERMEQALKESEEKFSKAFHASPEAIAILTAKDEKFIDVNDSYTQITGYSREELIGNTITSIHIWATPEDHTKMRKMMQEQGRIYNEEFDYRTKSGEIRTRLFSLEPITINGEPCTIGVSIDITERKRVEQALKESEEKFSKAFHALPEQVTIARMKDNTFVDINESFCRNNGYTREEVIGRKREELNLLIGPSQRDQIGKMVKERGRFKNIELECRDKSGETRTLLFSADIINIGGEPCQLTIANDITERKQMEQALKESEEKFSKAFHASPDAVSLITAEDERYIDINDSYTKMTGYSREELIGNTTNSINLWVNDENHTKMRKMMQEQGRIYNEEFDYRTKSGEIRTRLFSLEPITINGEPRTIGVSTDITERKRMEQALKESEEKFSKAFHALPEEVAIARWKDNVFIDVNESFCRNNGYTREEVIGHKGEELNLPIKPGQRDQVMKMVKERGRAENIELEFRKQSGETHTLLFSADTINLGGEPCLLTIGNDITKRKQGEKKLQQAMAELESSGAKLQATNKELESFSYSVSHDLRSPLRSIDGFSQALLEDYSAKLDEKGQDYLNRLRNASQKMGELIDGLLKLSRLTRSEMHYEKVNLTSLANEIAARLQETHDKRDVKFIIGSDLTATGDPQMLRVLLENLLGNSWKFTKNTKQACIEFGSTTDGERKTFFIKDNGAGFDMAFKDKLFGAFQRLHDAAEFPGAGIGLATVQRIINRHSGSIRAEGEMGKGATFYFILS